MSKPKDHNQEIELPTLEAPSATESSGAGGAVGALFAEETLATAAVKVMVLENLFAAVARDVKFAEFMRETLLIVMRAVHCEAGSILEKDEHNRCFFFRAMAGTSSDQLSKFTVPEGQGIVGYVAESRQPLVVTNVGENKIHLKAIEKAVGFEARNLIALPILIQGRIFGVMELLNRVGEEQFNASDIELLTYISNVTAKAIEIRLMLAWAFSNKKAA